MCNDNTSCGIFKKVQRRDVCVDRQSQNTNLSSNRRHTNRYANVVSPVIRLPVNNIRRTNHPRRFGFWLKKYSRINPLVQWVEIDAQLIEIFLQYWFPTCMYFINGTLKYQQVLFVTELQNVNEDHFSTTLQSKNAPVLYHRFYREVFDGIDNSSHMKRPEAVFSSRKELSLSTHIWRGEISRSYSLVWQRFMDDIIHCTEVNINVSVPKANRIMDNNM